MISSLAFIDPKAQIGEGVTVEPFATVYGDVVIGDGTWIGSGAVIYDGARIGKNCRIFNGASISAIPQDLKFSGEETTLEIGDNTTVREFATLNRGTRARGKTTIGNNCLLMAYVHVAHDCKVGNNVIIVASSGIAGEVELGDWVTLGGATVVHQFVRIGDHAMTAMCSLLFADLPPFVMCQGQPAAARSMNFEGLRRRGFSPDRISVVKAMHKALYRDQLTLDQAMQRIGSLTDKTPEAAPDVSLMLDFLRQASPQRGIVR